MPWPRTLSEPTTTPWCDVHLRLNTSLVLLAAAVVTAAAACARPAGEMVVGEVSADVSGEAAHAHLHEDGHGGHDAGLINTVGDVPDLDMIDISTGATVSLRSFLDGGKPLMFWFWVPH